MNIKKFLDCIILRIAFLYGKHHLKWFANFLYKRNFGRSVNWNNPVEFNEKILWMSFCTDTSKWSVLADKLSVRSFLNEKGFSDSLTKMYGSWSNAFDIDFDMLPDKFVIKTNHGYGDVFVIKDKRLVNVNYIRTELQKSIETPFGYSTAEPHYIKIKPCIIAEELLNNESSFSTSIVDYKFYCFSGEPLICGVFFNRDSITHENNSQFYDMEWNLRKEWKSPKLVECTVNIPKPKHFEKMKQMCRILCHDFPFVRLDLYESNGRVYFGEFTFTPAACTGGSLNPNLFLYLGSKIVLDNNTLTA